MTSHRIFVSSHKIKCLPAEGFHVLQEEFHFDKTLHVRHTESPLWQIVIEEDLLLADFSSYFFSVSTDNFVNAFRLRFQFIVKFVRHAVTEEFLFQNHFHFSFACFIKTCSVDHHEWMLAFGFDRFRQRNQRIFCHIICYCLSFFKTGHHLAMHRIERAATNAVVGMILQQSFPSISQFVMRIITANLVSQGCQWLSHIFKFTLHTGVSLFQINARRCCICQGVPAVSFLRSQLARYRGQILWQVISDRFQIFWPI